MTLHPMALYMRTHHQLIALGRAVVRWPILFALVPPSALCAGVSVRLAPHSDFGDSHGFATGVRLIIIPSD